MQSQNLLNIGSSYWLASRWGTSDDYGNIGMYVMLSGGKLLSSSNFSNVGHSDGADGNGNGEFFHTNSRGYGYINCYGHTYGLRPVFVLHQNVQLKGKGTQADPYYLNKP